MSNHLDADHAAQAAADVVAILTALHHYNRNQATANPADGIGGLLGELKDDGERMETVIAALGVMAHAWADELAALTFDGDWQAVMRYVAHDVLHAP